MTDESGNSIASTRLYTVEEANRALPLVRAIVRDIVSLAGSVMDRRERLDEVRGHRREDENDIYDEELFQIEEMIEKDVDQLDVYVKELQNLGIELKSMTEGLIDFPTIVSGKPAYLCWKYDEPQVSFWHELEAGFSGRQPIVGDRRRLPG
jgi:hypothetical protein